MSDKKYNGWTNYETWAVKLWLDNEEGSYHHWNEASISAWEATDEDDSQEDRKSEAAQELAGQLKSELEDACPDVQGLWADLLNAALSEVDWHEIATAMIEDCADAA